jgi:hypothetical protein
MIRPFKSLVAAAGIALAIGVGTAGPARADVIQLGFILDRSGSIGSTNWTTIVNGLATAINTIPVGGADQYEVTVVTFASTAATNVNRVLLTDATVRGDVASDVSSIPYTGGGTNFFNAFTEMRNTLLAGGASLLDATYLNFATDGVGTDGSAVRDQLILDGVDNISVEGIGSGVDVVDLTTNYCYPLACNTADPLNPALFPANGFYLAVADADAYAAAIGSKVRLVTRVPEPGTMALIGISLLGFGLARRRKA